jgi:MOSC domain-containing protein
MPGRVARISIAPVKALGLVHPEAVDLGPGGVAGDRRFWLVDGNGRLVNDKRHPQLLRVRPAWDEGARTLRLDFPEGTAAEGVVELGAPADVKLYGEPHPSRHVVGPWQEALSRYAGEPLTLLWSESGAVDRGVAGAAVSLVSRGSLERLRAQLGVDRPVDGRRFRMLFEIDGVPAHAEDEWIGARVRIGAAEVELAGDVGRCAVTTLHPDRGVRDLDTLGALAEYRREGRTEPLPLGVYGAVAVPGRVCVGDALLAPAAADAPSRVP